MKKGNLFLGTLVALASIQAHAQTSAATPAATEAPKPTLAERMNIRYTAFYFGASIADPFDSVKTFTANNPDGSAIAGYRDPSNQVSLRNRLDLRFKPTDDFRFGPTILFDYKGRSNAELVLVDPFLSASVPKLGAIGDVNLSGELRVALPLSNASQIGTLVTSINPRLTAAYSIPDTSLTISSLTYPTYRIYRKTAAQKTFIFNQWFDATYKFTDTFNSYVAYNLSFDVAASKTSKTDTFLELGFNWDFIKGLTLTGYVDLETDFRIAPDTSMWGANLSWAIL